MSVESTEQPLLSLRERQVVALVADGKSNKEIGAALGLSAATVKTHLQRIAKKVGEGNRSGIVAYCFREGIIE